MNKYCLITNDVECTSLLNHRLDPLTAQFVFKQGMPRLLDLYEKFNVKATFFYTGKIAELVPEVVKMAYAKGHEIGCHGYSHEVNQAFDVLSFDQQKEHLYRSKSILEDIIGEQIISFRAPAARVNQNTARALIETGFKIDSSISSQRIDMFMSFGTLKKLHWLTAPRLPYFTDINNIFKKGDSPLLEIPISAFIFPYIGTFMRIAPVLNRMTRNLLHLETKLNGRPFVFLTHPNEFVNEERDGQHIQRRGSNYFSYLIGDVLRHRLKVKNLGKDAIPILEKELFFFQKKQYQFVSCNLYYKLIKIK
ncbi:polysaccharide deacetylase family protein [bacterium]|nr:polysaccharide deacetylase family protein [bacterium]